MAKLLEEIHPGESLLEDFMKRMGISARQPTADIDVSPSRISELVNGQCPITADTALRLGLFFGVEARFWLNLQSEYDIRVADRELRAKLSPRVCVFRQHRPTTRSIRRCGRINPEMLPQQARRALRPVPRKQCQWQPPVWQSVAG